MLQAWNHWVTGGSVGTCELLSEACDVPTADTDAYTWHTVGRYIDLVYHRQAPDVL